MLTSFDDLAEFERDFIRARTGRKRAKAKSVKFGGSAAPASVTPHQRREVIQRLAQGAGQADLARSYGVPQATIKQAGSLLNHRQRRE